MDVDQLVDTAAAEFSQFERYEYVGSTRINHVKVGSGSKNILCIPGTLGVWQDFAPLFSRIDLTKYTVVAIDPPGYGKSIPPERKYTMVTNHEDAKVAHALMKQLNLLPFSCFGWSEGMRSASICAVLFPADVKSCVVWGGVSNVTEGLVKFFKAMRDLDNWPSRKSLARFDAIYGRDYFRKTWEAEADFYVTCFTAVPKGNLIADLLPRVKAPYLLIWCGKDTMGGEGIKEQYKTIVNKVKNGRLVEKADGTHDVHLQQRDWFLKTALDFVDET